MYSYIKNKNQNQKDKEKKAVILIAVILIAIATVISTGAYKRLWVQGGLLYEPQKEAQNAPERELAPEKEQIDQKEEINRAEQATVDKIAQFGVASWYDYSLGGQEWSKTHNTCASRDLPRYSTAIVTNLENGASVECYVNDYIEHPERVIDLSSHAFSQIADLSRGLVKVKIIKKNH